MFIVITNLSIVLMYLAMYLTEEENKLKAIKGITALLWFTAAIINFNTYCL